MVDKYDRANLVLYAQSLAAEIAAALKVFPRLPAHQEDILASVEILMHRFNDTWKKINERAAEEPPT